MNSKMNHLWVYKMSTCAISTHCVTSKSCVVQSVSQRRRVAGLSVNPLESKVQRLLANVSLHKVCTKMHTSALLPCDVTKGTTSAILLLLSHSKHVIDTTKHQFSRRQKHFFFFAGSKLGCQFNTLMRLINYISN